MALAPGTRLGAYEILTLIGSGGMGEVYRATDTKLHRDVAIKVLPSDVAADPDRLARFEREAQVLASLNHPNIAHIHGVDDSAGVPALIMELVEGPTLADRIAKGSIPLDEALPIAKQIAEALEAAHEQGIIHRDLKPANIKVRPDGTVKVLDFGLAKAFDPASASSGHAMNSPTITARTVHGVILGTAAYVSPEQAVGKSVDKRTDIWAFGVVLMEMLTGRRVFAGETISHVLAAVLATEPDWSRLPESTPPRISLLLRRCLSKDPRRRLHDIADVRIEVDESERAEPMGIRSTRRTAREQVAWSVAGFLSLAIAVLFWMWPTGRSTTPAAQPVHVEVELGQRMSLREMGANVVLSSDGGRIAFATSTQGVSHLLTRRLDESHANELAGTDGATAPFFSPDGQWIGFFSEGKLKKISINGGAPITLCDAPNPRGASWTQDGTIILTTDVQTPLLRIPASGGYAPTTLTTFASGEISNRWPQVLPDGKAVLFTALTAANFAAFDEANIKVMTLPNGTPKTVLKGGSYGRYLSSGHLVYVRNGTVFAIPFDIARLEVHGTPVPVIEGVSYVPTGGSAQLDVSVTGLLAYERGAIPTQTIQWLDASGHTDPLVTTPGSYTWPRLSPDGTRLLYRLAQGPRTDIWLHDVGRGTDARLTTDGGIHNSPVWSADGRFVAYQAEGGLFWIAADAAGKPRRLIEATNTPFPESFSADGRWLAYSVSNPVSGDLDIWAVPLTGEGEALHAGEPKPLIRTSGNDRNAAFSPDGRWLAYDSSESGVYEVYVRPFPQPTERPEMKWRVSTAGGFNARWSRNGRELFYSVNNRLMVATYTSHDDMFVAETPRLWSAREVFAISVMPTFDLSPDSQRVAVDIPTAPATPPETGHHVTLVLNFFDELRKTVPLRP
jgi:serine/threonine-protein kinase